VLGTSAGLRGICVRCGSISSLTTAMQEYVRHRRSMNMEKTRSPVVQVRTTGDPLSAEIGVPALHSEGRQHKL
jgi:hypothetical protein